MLCERSQSQEVAYCISTIPFLWSVQLSIPGPHHQNYNSEIFNLCHSVFSSSCYFSFYSLLLLHLLLYLVETSRLLNSSLSSDNPRLSLLLLLSSSDHVVCHFNYFLASIKSFAQMSFYPVHLERPQPCNCPFNLPLHLDYWVLLEKIMQRPIGNPQIWLPTSVMLNPATRPPLSNTTICNCIRFLGLT